MAKSGKKPKTKPRKSSGRMASKGFPNPIDVHVGQRMRQRRTLLGMSQSVLGDAIGLTFQQVQKYERGANRVSGSRLFDLGRVLDVPVAYFFEEMPGDMAKKSPSHLTASSQLRKTAKQTLSQNAKPWSW
jgi:transcriptional regulator with XRE-family HTH domain